MVLGDLCKMSTLLSAEWHWWLVGVLSAVFLGALLCCDSFDAVVTMAGSVCSRHYHACLMLVSFPALVLYLAVEANRSNKANAEWEGVTTFTEEFEAATKDVNAPSLPVESSDIQPAVCTEKQEKYQGEHSSKHVVVPTSAAAQAVPSPATLEQSGDQFRLWDADSDCTPDCQIPEKALPQVPCLDPGLPMGHPDGETLHDISPHSRDLCKGHEQDEVSSTAQQASPCMLDAKFSEDSSQIPADFSSPATADASHILNDSMPPKEQPLPCAPRHHPGLPASLFSTEVLVNIYDVSQDPTVQKLNELLAHRYSPFKFGGIFHAGVEMLGQEWSFGFVACGTGVHRSSPRNHPHHHFRETIRLGPTRLSHEEVLTLMSAISLEYPGNSYHLLKRNCCHFASDLCMRLGVGELPSWIQRLARIGDSVLSVSQDIEKSIAGLHLSRSDVLRHDLTSQSNIAQI